MDKIFQSGSSLGQGLTENVTIVSWITAIMLMVGTTLYFVKKFFKEMCTIVLCVCTFAGVFIFLVVLWTDILGFAHAV